MIPNMLISKTQLRSIVTSPIELISGEWLFLHLIMVFTTRGSCIITSRNW